jgi:pilus assembly protein Flp/PilA
VAAGYPLIRKTIRRFVADADGATAIEYGLIVAFIFLAIVGGLTAFAGNENAMYTRISNAIVSATH